MSDEQVPSPPPVVHRSGGGSVAWAAVGVYAALVVLQVLMGFLFFNNAYAEMDPNGRAINSTVASVLLFSPSLIALGLVIWTIVAMVRAKRRATAAGPAAPTPTAASPATPGLPPMQSPPLQRGSRMRMGALIGSATFLITCAGPCFGPSLMGPLTTSTQMQTKAAASLPLDQRVVLPSPSGASGESAAASGVPPVTP